mgnify:FL=1
MADGFENFTENLFKVGAIGLVIIWAITYLLRKFEVIKFDFKPGLGITLLAIALGLMAAYMVIVKKGFKLELKDDLLPLVLTIAIVVGAIYFLPMLLPDLYSIGAVQIHGVVQSIVGGG